MIRIRWPVGKYALPMTKKGCPQDRGWHEGGRLQETHKKWGEFVFGKPSARSTMSGEFKSESIKTYYCVKDSNRMDTAPWPKGNYCIAQKGGECPLGFVSGHVTWNDRNWKRHGKTWGTLPDGIYRGSKNNKGTTIYYCCHSDGHYGTPMLLPTNKPFYISLSVWSKVSTGFWNESY